MSTRLKVTGIDVFSAGDFAGAQGTEQIVLNDAPRGVYKKLVLKDDKLAGALMFGDVTDDAWYLDLIRGRTNVSCLRAGLMFGRAVAESIKIGARH